LEKCSNRSEFLKALVVRARRPRSTNACLATVSTHNAALGLIADCGEFDEKVREGAIVGLDHLFSIVPNVLPPTASTHFTNRTHPQTHHALGNTLQRKLQGNITRTTLDIARILATITLPMMEADTDALSTFMADFVVSMKQISPGGPDLVAEKERAFEEMAFTDTTDLAMEITHFSVRR
jgi:hypothetical protein